MHTCIHTYIHTYKKMQTYIHTYIHYIHYCVLVCEGTFKEEKNKKVDSPLQVVLQSKFPVVCACVCMCVHAYVCACICMHICVEDLLNYHSSNDLQICLFSKTTNVTIQTIYIDYH